MSTERIKVEVYLDRPEGVSKVEAARRIQEVLADQMPRARATVSTTSYSKVMTDNEVLQASARAVRVPKAEVPQVHYYEVRGVTGGRFFPAEPPTEEVDSCNSPHPDSPAADPNACTPGQQCQSFDRLCSKHSWEYQNQHGRAANE